MALLELRQFSFTYPSSDQPALRAVDLCVQQGEFIVICGPSGCGKTTLVRSMKREIAPYGQTQGALFYQQQNILDSGQHVSSSNIGFVMQDPDNQIVTDTVWHELAFGLENEGLPTSVIRRRVAETAHFFGMNDWFEQSVFSLSGGQKQVLNLAAVMAMQPDLIILDEPVAQLDPIAAKEFISVLQRIHLELGTTVIMTEHMLEDIFPLADKVVYMTRGQVAYTGTPRAFVQHAVTMKQHAYEKAFPSAVRIARDLGETISLPITVNEGRRWLKQYMTDRQRAKQVKQSDHAADQFVSAKNEKPANRKDQTSHGSEEELSRQILAKEQAKILLKADHIWFRYQPDQPFVLRGFSCQIKSGEILAIVGGNGSGKSTALNILAGLASPQRGKITAVPEKKLPEQVLSDYKTKLNRHKTRGKKKRQKKERKNLLNITLLPQNPKSVFVADTLMLDLLESALLHLPDKKAAEQAVYDLAFSLGLKDLLLKHPYDLSGGEQQKAAMAKLLLLDPDLLLLDEPTKGLDIYAKMDLGDRLQTLKKEGKAIVLVTHDIEFAALYTDRCAMIFNGEITCSDQAKAFFAGNTFYTTAANRISRGLVEGAVTEEDVVSRCLATS